MYFISINLRTVCCVFINFDLCCSW